MTTIREIVEDRKIREILHFSTNHGLVGMATLGAVISRDQLSTDSKSPLFALSPQNAKFRSDPDWLGYVNLSISRINSSFFEFSKRWKRSPDDYWVILSFNPEILSHDGIVFSTTNNIYHGSCIRSSGLSGLENCFADVVTSKNYKNIVRPGAFPRHWTTCQEAEVLYPKKLSLEFLQCIYVDDEETSDQVLTTIELLMGRSDFNVIINPDKFKGG
ncbi:TPA: DarT ssDNA thymidine ADP-ribosyltransferase family protein [Photobacterium damselae]